MLSLNQLKISASLKGQSHLGAIPGIWWGYTKKLRTRQREPGNSQVNFAEPGKAPNTKFRGTQNMGTQAMVCLSKAGPKPASPLLHCCMKSSQFGWFCFMAHNNVGPSWLEDAYSENLPTAAAAAPSESSSAPICLPPSISVCLFM